LYWNRGTTGGSILGWATNTTQDKFTGNNALKVFTPTTTNTSSTIFAPLLEDTTNYFHWEHFVTASPVSNEYRYLMYSWKNVGGNGKMGLYLYQNGGQGIPTLQMVCGAWVAAANRLFVPAPVANTWETVIVDLYEEFGPAMITGIGFYWGRGAESYATSCGLFDNIYLGTNIAELVARIPVSVQIADTFSRTGALNGSAPGTRMSNEVWSTVVSGADNWSTDGATAVIPTGSSTDNAYLPFKPKQGHIYYLTADISVTASDPDRTADWIGMAFMTSAVTGQLFTADAGGILLKRNGEAVTAFCEGSDITYTNGSPSAEAKVLLDTTSVNWRMSWFVNGSLIRNEVFSQNPTNITKIAIGNLASAVGRVDNLVLEGN
jgi:hypothetical protein